MSNLLRYTLTLTLVLSTLLILAACGGSDGTTTTATTPQTTQAPQQPAEAAPATAPDAPTRPSTIAPLTAPEAQAPTGPVDLAMPGPAPVQRLVMSMTAPTDETNSALNVGGTSGWQLGPMYEWAASVDPGTGAYTPMLAEDWSIAEQSIKYTFREGVQFHNGWGELTAYDFEDSVRDAMHEDNPGSAQYRANIDNVEVLNDREAVVNLKRINVTLFRNISQFVGGFELMSSRNFDELGRYPSLDEPPLAGTGPYQFVERSEGELHPLQARSLPALARHPGVRGVGAPLHFRGVDQAGGPAD